jgi:hypothetical protein
MRCGPALLLNPSLRCICKGGWTNLMIQSICRSAAWSCAMCQCVVFPCFSYRCIYE